MEADVRSELAQALDRERRRADPVDVVVAVDDDARSGVDRAPERHARLGRRAEEQGIVPRQLSCEECPRLGGVAVPAPDEDACGRLADADRRREGARLPVRARTDCPRALLHPAFTLRSGSDVLGDTLLVY